MSTKSLIKQAIPVSVWKLTRESRSYFRRLFLDIRQTFSLSHPVGSFQLIRLVRFVRPQYTMIKPPRLRLLYELSKKIDEEKLEGAIVECGVYKGGSAAVMVIAQRKPLTRDIWLFDSFEGLPPPSNNDGAFERENYYKGWCEGHVEDVEDIWKKLELPREQLHIVKGWFQDTFPTVSIPKIALLHVDADWYESVNDSLQKFYQSVVPGGYIEFDDYGSWEGCKKAVDEFFTTHNIKAELKTRDRIGYYFQKPV
jgi:O-methyltransferase